MQFSLADPGVVMIGMERKARIELVTRDGILALLPDAKVKATENQPFPVRRVECAKALLRVVDSEGRARPSATATNKAGLACEIRPLLDPTRGPFGGDLPFRVYLPAGGDGVEVRATHDQTGNTETCRTDAEGLGHFRLRSPGTWRVEAHRWVTSPEEPSGRASANIALPELQTATLLFEIPGGSNSEQQDKARDDEVEAR